QTSRRAPRTLGALVLQFRRSLAILAIFQQLRSQNLRESKNLRFTIQNFFSCNAQKFGCVSMAGVKSAINEGLRTFFMGPSPSRGTHERSRQLQSRQDPRCRTRIPASTAKVAAPAARFQA